VELLKSSAATAWWSTLLLLVVVAVLDHPGAGQQAVLAAQVVTARQ
jgi:succinate dehydrogenase hydrophobic anchor subunit